MILKADCCKRGWGSLSWISIKIQFFTDLSSLFAKMAQQQLDKEQEELVFQLSEKTGVSYSGTLVHFIIFPTEEGSDGIDPTVVSYTTAVWKKLKYQMSRATAQLKEREKGKIKLMANKYLDIKPGSKDEKWFINIMTYTRSGSPIYNSCVFFSEEEWMNLVNAEPKITEKIEYFAKKEHTAKKLRTSLAPQQGSSRMGILFHWVYLGKTSEEKFFTKEHAMENCRALFSEASNNEITINKEQIIPPSLPKFLRFAYCYGKRAIADQAYTYQVDTDNSFDTILENTEVPHNYLVTAFTQFYLYMGIPLAASKAEPYITSLLAYNSIEELNKETKAMDMMAKSANHLLCRDIIPNFLPVVVVE